MSLKQDLIHKEINGFRVTDCIGEGGMAYVFRAENIVDPKIVRALKIIRPEYLERNLFFERFAREARVLESLQHPHIVRFHGLRKARDLLVMELEYLHGQTLIDPPFCHEPTPLEHVLIWITQVACALSIAHDMRIVHRDIKPANLFLTQSGQVKILDFGIAKVLDSIEEDRTGTLNGHVLGSPAYMAPEVCQGHTPTPQADVYALGLITYHLLMGRHPLIAPHMTQRTTMQMMLTHLHHTPPHLKEILDSPPKGLDRVLKRAVAQDPSERYPSAAHFARALKPFVKDFKQLGHLPLINDEDSFPYQPSTKQTITHDHLQKLPSQNGSLRSILLFIFLLFIVGSVIFYQDLLYGQLKSIWPQQAQMNKTTSLAVATFPPDAIQWVPVIVPSDHPTQSFEMSKSEVTIAQYYQCVIEKGCEPPPIDFKVSYGECLWQAMYEKAPSKQDKNRPILLKEFHNKPINCITYREAKKFAQWSKARLMSKEEWQFAVRGSDSPIHLKNMPNIQIYPWGNHKPNCEYAVMYEQAPACGQGTQPHTVCSKILGMNTDGICDLVGNVWEWSNGAKNGKAIVLGGGWFSAAESMHSNAYNTRSLDHRDSSVGFRIVRTKQE